MILIGNGFDCHEIIISDNSDLINYIALGGVKIYCNKRFKAHSDGDVIIHAFIDSIISPLFNVDIGQIFPDKKKKYKNIESIKLLKIVKDLIFYEYLINGKKENGNIDINEIKILDIKKRFEKTRKIRIINVDITVVCEQIKISNYKDKIINNLNSIFKETIFSIKGKRTEGGFKKNYCYVWVSSLIELT